MKCLLFFTSVFLISSAAFGQTEILYTVSFPNAIHHEAEISIMVPKVPAGVMKFRMSRSSPGRYATHEFGKNVYNVKAMDEKKSPLSVKQTEGDSYEIGQHSGTVIISYTLFGNWIDGTYTGISENTAHLNMPATFMWVYGMDLRPIRFKFNDLDNHNWQVFTQLKPEPDGTYFAPNLQYMMDSPTSLSASKMYSWTITNPDGKKQTLQLASHSDDDQETVNNFGKMVQRIALEEQAVFGELPTYDYGNYVFIHDVYPTNSGDGMEHRNSTVITQTSAKIAGNEARLQGTFAHEFFHSWNMERIRSRYLEPFNFEHANMSSELWFGEGFTQYYGNMILTRAGLRSVNDYAQTAASQINTVLNNPGAKQYSADQMSRYSVFSDAAVSIDATNSANIFTSYYTYGSAIALALDLRLRSEFSISLDDYMQAVWIAHGKKEKGYAIPELQNVLAVVTKNQAFATDFFKRYVYGIEKNDYLALLDKAGFVLRKAQTGKAWAGALRGAGNSEGFLIQGNTLVGSPIYISGLDAGDIILTADGKEIKDLKAFNDLVADKKPGEKLPVTYKNRSGNHETVITLVENPTLEVVTYETAGKEMSAEQVAFRKSWLESKVK